MVARRRHHQAHRQQLKDLSLRFSEVRCLCRVPLRYHAIRRFASNIVGRAGLTRHKKQARERKRNGPSHRWNPVGGDDLKVRPIEERWGAGVETQKNVRGEIGGWGRVPFNEPYAPSLSTIYDGA